MSRLRPDEAQAPGEAKPRFSSAASSAAIFEGFAADAPTGVESALPEALQRFVPLGLAHVTSLTNSTVDGLPGSRWSLFVVALLSVSNVRRGSSARAQRFCVLIVEASTLSAAQGAKLGGVGEQDALLFFSSQSC